MINSVTARTSATASSATTSTDFATPAPIYSKNDVEVYVDGDKKTVDSHYTVTIATDNTANVNFTSGNVPADSSVIVIVRSLAYKQEQNFINNDALDIENVETGLDKLTIMSQQLADGKDYSFKFSKDLGTAEFNDASLTGSNFENVQDRATTLSAGKTARTNKLLSFDSNGDIQATQEIGTYKGTDATTTTAAYVERDLVKSTTAGQLDNVYICIKNSPSGTALTNTTYWNLVVDAYTAASSSTSAASSATAAAASASAASTSESNASTSESNALSYKNSAETAKTAAETAQTAAETAKTAAESSETAAASSETAAASSATSAASSATTATTQASTATTKATEAATSATTATTKASEAATSATNAASSATTATTQATTATTKASEASTSATNAATSATAAAASQTAAAASAASAATSYDSFDDRYLGVKSSNPTQDNDGNALVSGALYFSDSANEMRVYDGANWIAATSAGNVSFLVYEYTATASQTTFSGSDDNGASLSYTVGNIKVVMNGVILDSSDFTATSGTSVVLASSAALNDLVTVYAYKSFTTADMVPASTGGTFAGNVAVTGNIQVDDIVEKTSAHGVEIEGVLLKDSTITGGTIEGTAVISTGESGGSKFLREDGDGTCSWQAVAGFPSGTKMLFHQTSAPTGWTKVTTTGTGSASINDVGLRIVTGTITDGVGGSVAFDTAFASQTIDTTTLSVSQIPSHDHRLEMHNNHGSTASLGGAYSSNTDSPINKSFITHTGGGGSHGHGSINLDVKYIDLIVASKD